jgi:NAD(P)-dependent dehydrogenase (short-subunit alcohol dehydrogenase family)
MATRAVLVTGSSSGFGLETAALMATRGWRVFATMRDLARRGPLEERVSRDGTAVEVLSLDVTDPESVERAVGEALGRAGGIDAVVSNAGIGDAGFFEDVPDEQVRRVMETNFFGPLAIARAVLPSMRARGHGRIVAVSSVGAFAASPGLSVYAASKWALEGWAEALAIEVAPFGIDVVLVEPGTYKTGIWTAAAITRRPDGPYARFVDAMEPRVRESVERFGRDPREVAERISRLLEARHPSLRHPVGPDAHVTRVLSRALPFAVRRRLVSRMSGLDGAGLGSRSSKRG